MALASSALLCQSAAAAERAYVISSSPSGVFGTVSGKVEQGETVRTSTPPEFSGALRFSRWEINGVPALCPSGQAQRVVGTVAADQDLQIVAHYLPVTEDQDGDNLPDWREWRELGTLTSDAGSQPVADGIDLARKLDLGYAFGIAQHPTEGGVFRSSSRSFAFHDPQKVLAYTVTSVPAGLCTQSGFARVGSIVNSPNLHDGIFGYRLAYWTLNGSRFSAPNGGTPTRASFPLTLENSELVAHFLPEAEDSDSDTLPDWRELRVFGNLAASLASDPDGDGWSVAAADARGYPLNTRSQLVEGGVFRSSSATVTFHNPGAINSYTIVSEPAGYYQKSGQAPTGTVLTMPNLFGVTSGYRFACWLVDGQPFTGPDGSCPIIPNITLVHDAQRMVAKFVPENQDSDVDGIPDWMEWWKFGKMSYDQSHDPDRDGFTIATELTHGEPLTIRSFPAEGGIFRSSSATCAYHDPEKRFAYTVASNPPGLVNAMDRVVPDTEFTTPNLNGELQGDTFTHWTVDDTRIEAENGSALTRVKQVINRDLIRFTAHFLPTSQDSDADAIPDWFEIRYFGDLFQSRQTFSFDDGFSNGSKIGRGYPVTTRNVVAEGGVFRSSSASLAYHDPAKLVFYQITSEPAGLQNQSAMVATGTEITTPNLSGATQGYSFAYWAVDGVRQHGGTTAAQTRVTVKLERDFMKIVAHYVPTTQDSDADGIPDHYEWFHFGTLDHQKDSIPAEDGWKLGQAIDRGYSPAVRNRTEEGGVFRTSSKSLTYHDPERYKVFEFASSPLGLLQETRLVTPGSLVLTPVLNGESQGYRFAYWSLNGVRKTNSTGIALSRFSVVAEEDMSVIANYVPTSQDSDTDSLPDWWEQFYLGSLDHSLTSVTDQDGFTLSQKTARGYTPGIHAELAEGGVFRSSSKSVRFHNPGVYCTYTMRSQPEGLIATDHGMVTPGTRVSSPVLTGSTQGYTFAYWTIDGVRQTTPQGHAIGKVSATISQTTEIIAHYFADAADSDADGLKDAFEWYAFGSLDYNRLSDPHNDGTSIARKQELGYAPAVGQLLVEGGVFRSSSKSIATSLAAYNFFHNLTIQVSPADSGTVSGAGSYRQGVVASLAPTPKPGFQFSHWGGDLDSSATPGRIAMDVPHTVTAVFIPADPYLTWQQLHFGTNPPDSLASDLADPDHDGLPNLLECALHGDPLAPGPLIHAATTPDGLSITFERDSSIPQITLDVEYTNSLTTDSWQPIARSENGAPTAALAPTVQTQETTFTTHPTIQSTTVTRPIQPNEPKGFLRVKARR